MAFIEISFNTKRPLILGRGGFGTQLNDWLMDEGWGSADFLDDNAPDAVEPGCIILPQAYVGADAHLGVGCIVNAGAIVDHNAHLGRGVHVAPGGIVKASAEVTDFGKVDSGEIVRSPWENQ